ncbi:ChaT1 protein [Fructobacillus pseudoficulneus]|uniref:ChaT1 protein n=1 Tax=Fructobacillus pseudoficulneus TaxID=220714 RepID=A0A3F3H541_9LACO|nr:DHA2 family efflux MFS transporter permease subunit [Fructobacillus pseudoficulneus]GAP03408.1 ChaT1 protein [Fructobacillus pseudoficulneus]SEH46320.1 MFS transporter, DHA2 family, multidrug resistance protein [Fructobacillus pseudoficulneus]
MNISEEKRSVKRWWALLALSLGVFMGLLDVNIVNVALPTMVKSFHTTFSNVQWVISSYTISYAVVILVLSKLADMYGRKKMFLTCMIIFVAASAMNGLASNLLVLNIGRAIQAFGGGGLMTISMALVASIFEGKERGFAMGILGSVMGLSTVAGPLIGGILSEAFGWPAIFYVNVPIGVFAAILVWFTVAETPSYGQGQKIDFVGMLLSAAAIFSAVYGLIQKEDNPHLSWSDPKIALWLVAGAVLLAIFITVELKIDKPMMNLTLFKNKNFVGAVIVAFALGSAIYANNVFLTSLMQNYMGYSAFDTGIRQIPLTMWALILGPLTGYLSSKFSTRKLISGSLFVAAISFLVFWNAMTTKLTYTDLLLPLVLLGISNALINPLLNNAGLAGAKPEEIGMTSGLINVFRQLGVSFGVVILGLAQTNQYDGHLNNHLSVQGPAGDIVAGIKHVFVEAGPFAGHSLVYGSSFAHWPLLGKLQSVVSNAFFAGMRGLTAVSFFIVVIASLFAYVLLMDKDSDKA